MPAVGQGESKLCLRQATVCDSAFRSGHFRLYVSLLSGNHERNITLASKMSYPTTNFAKGSHDKLYFLRLCPTDSSTPAPWRLHTKPYKMLKTSSFRSFFQRPGENCGLILLAGWIALKVFLFYPLTIYATNAEEIQVGFHSLVFLYLIPFLVFGAILR